MTLLPETDKSPVRKTIAYVFNAAHYKGGGEISLMELIDAVDRRAVEPVIFIPGRGEIARKYTGGRLNFLIVPLPALKKKWGLAAFGALLNLMRMLCRHRVDLIHANGSRACFYCGVAGRLSGIPVVWHVRETVKDLKCYDGLLGLMTTGILCVSKSVGVKRFDRFGPRIREKTGVIYNGVDTEKFKIRHRWRSYFRQKLGISDGEVLFGLIGNIVTRKRQDFFLRALIRARRERAGLPVRAVIIGKIDDTSFLEVLKDLIARGQLAGVVHLMDYIEKIHLFYSALDVLVLTSESEGFPRSVIEGMSCGLPVLGSDIPEIREAVADPVNGTLVPLDDTETLAGAIAGMAADPAGLKRIGRTNRRKAMDRFSLNAHSQAVLKLYRDLLRA